MARTETVVMESPEQVLTDFDKQLEDLAKESISSKLSEFCDQARKVATQFLRDKRMTGYVMTVNGVDVSRNSDGLAAAILSGPLMMTTYVEVQKQRAQVMTNFSELSVKDSAPLATPSPVQALEPFEEDRE